MILKNSNQLSDDDSDYFIYVYYWLIRCPCNVFVVEKKTLNFYGSYIFNLPEIITLLHVQCNNLLKSASVLVSKQYLKKVVVFSLLLSKSVI